MNERYSDLGVVEYARDLGLSGGGNNVAECFTLTRMVFGVEALL